MAGLNSMEYSQIFMAALDKQMVEGATSGWMEENAGQVKYNGGNEIKIPKMSMNGLSNYSRDDGFVQGSVTYEYELRKLTQDRGITFQLDAMDVDETNFGAAAGNVLGEFQRTKVVPEIDAYRYSKIAMTAIEANKKTEYTPAAATILSRLMEDIATVQDIAGSSYEVVVTMATPVAAILDNASGLGKRLDVMTFQQGSVHLNVKSIDGNPIIRVPSLRMKTAYKFLDGTTADEKNGGFQVDTTNAKEINWLITVRRAPIAISKTDVTRIFDPMTNQKANAWKIDYRKYHDLWIPDNAIDGIWANIKSN